MIKNKKNLIPKDFGEFKAPTKEENKIIKDSLIFGLSESLIEFFINSTILFLCIFLFLHSYELKQNLITFFVFLILSFLYRKSLILDKFLLYIYLSKNSYKIKYVKPFKLKNKGILCLVKPKLKIKNENNVVYDKVFAFSSYEVNKEILPNINNSNKENIVLLEIKVNKKEKNKYICVCLRAMQKQD